MSIIEIFVDRKRSVIFCMILCLLFGIHAYRNIPIEENPEIKIPMIIVTITMNGISPEDCQRVIVSQLDPEFGIIDGVKHVTSHASLGAATFMIEFVAGSDIDDAMQNVRNKYDDNLYKLPKEADRAIIQDVDLGKEPILDIALFGDVDMKILTHTAREMKKEIEKLSGIHKVKLKGEPKDVIEIELKPSFFEMYKVPHSYVAKIISENNQLVALGSISDKSGEYNLKMSNLITEPQELINFPVYAGKVGATVRLKDIAIVKDTFKTPTSIARIDGKPGVIIEVSKKTGANTIAVAKMLKTFVAEYAKTRALPINIKFGNDSAHRIHETVSDLENGILFAGLLVLIVVIISVGTRAALLVAFSLPVSFFIAILFLYFLNLTLNVIVLFSLILTIGMVVDDAIVVSEYADCRMIEGKSSKEAFIESVHRMFVPILSATLVKIIVFLPLLFWPGTIGEFMRYMPITVIIIMSASLLFAILFQPALGALLIRGNQKYTQSEIDAIHGAENCDISKLGSMTRKYAILLEKVLNNSKRFLIWTISLVFGVYAIFGVFGPGVDFFPNIEPEMIKIVVHGQGNMSMTEKVDIFKDLERKLNNYKKDINVVYGVIEDGESSDGIGTIMLQLGDWHQRRKAKEIVAGLISDLNTRDDIMVEVLNAQSGPKAEKSISISVCGDKIADIRSFLNLVEGEMSRIGTFIDIENSIDIPTVEWLVNVDKNRAAMYKLTPSDISGFLSMATGGMKISTYNRDEEVDIVMRFPEKYRKITNIKNLNIVSNEGLIVPLSAIVNVSPAIKVGTLKSIDNMLTISIGANVKNGITPAQELAKLKKFIDKNKPDNINILYLGDDESQSESSGFLKIAFSTSLLMMIFVILVQFNSIYDTIVVMSAVFLSTAGVLLGLLIAYEPFGIVMSGIGVIALSGIVLNNNILFVDTFQKFHQEGYSARESIMRAGIQRMRPILLTALTAILGLMPLVMKLTINFVDRQIYYDAPSSQWWTQLATSIAGGLSFATILTLFCTPAMLMIYHGRQEKLT